MSLNLFKGQFDDSYNNMYAQLSTQDKCMVDLYGLLVINKKKAEPPFDIKQETIFNKEMNRFMARYIVEVPLTLNNKSK